MFITTISGPGAGRITEAVPKLAAQATHAGLQRLSTHEELAAYLDQQAKKRDEGRSKLVGLQSRQL